MLYEVLFTQYRYIVTMMTILDLEFCNLLYDFQSPYPLLKMALIDTKFIFEQKCFKKPVYVFKHIWKFSLAHF